MKVCSRCGHEKALSEYNRNSHCPDGRRSECRECQREGDRGYVADPAVRERRRKAAADWWADHGHERNARRRKTPA